MSFQYEKITVDYFSYKKFSLMNFYRKKFAIDYTFFIEKRIVDGISLHQNNA